MAGCAEWKSIFERSRPRREAAGISESEAFRNADSPNNVWVIGVATSKDAVVEFFASVDQKELMKKAGVISALTITLLAD